jgi:thiol-disulfide isomerase/thioredoxin
MRWQLVLGILALGATMTVGDEPKSATPREQYETLIKEHDAACEAWKKSNPIVPTDSPLWSQWYDTNPEHGLGPRLFRFAETHPGDPAAVSALLRILAINPSAREQGVYPIYLRARDLLIRDHLLDPVVVKTLLARPTPIALGMEPYFRALIARTTDHETLGRACMALVQCDEARSRLAARPFFDYPEPRPERVAATAHLNSRIHPDYVRSIRETDQDALDDEIETLLERVAREFSDVPFLRAEMQAKRKETRSLADYAKEKLTAIQTLGVGQVAPEIVGKGLDGRPLKLSDFRGKVVMLVFWGTWCGPCMRLVLEEKALVERLKGRPFALVGVNAESDPVRAKQVIEEQAISWPSFDDGDPTRGPIARRWNVRGWPTIYLLDAKGVIRLNKLPHHDLKLLDEKVDELLKELQP